MVRIKTKLMLAACATLVVISGNILVSQASNGTPGSVDDPLVTKSYVDRRINELLGLELPTPVPSTGTFSGQALTVIQLFEGQTLYADAGTEIIVRTGKTVAVSSDENGIPDVTAGRDIRPGELIDTNHLLVFPREGRGITPASGQDGEIHVMIRGSYRLVNADGSVAAP